MAKDQSPNCVGGIRARALSQLLSKRPRYTVASSGRCGSQLGGGIENGTDDLVVAGAPAEVAG
jgi:hypothetical protein